MDILTHALIGTASAAGWLPSHPEFACGIVFGNVVPDLDAFSRLGGKRAFVRCHQTYTHSITAVVTVLLASLGLLVVGSPDWSAFAAGLAVGMVMHIGLDLTNSYGVKWAWPLSQQRVAFDWIFFIDAPILVLTSTALVVAWWLVGNAAALAWVSGIYLAGLFACVVVRALIARRARRIARSNDPTAIQTAVIPTTWLPWRFLVCHDHGQTSITSTLNAITWHENARRTIKVFDAELPLAVLELPEWRSMRELSPHYHAIEQTQSANELTIVGRDLRIRNFDTRFGALTCQLDSTGQIITKRWEV